MSMHSLTGVVAGVISITAFLPYAHSVVSCNLRPSSVTWLIWTVVGGLLFASYDAVGGGAARWVPLTDALGPAVIAYFSLSYRQGGFSRFDVGCLALAAGSVIAWVWTGSPAVALAINLFIALLGALPTFRNAYRNPASEPALAWGMFLLGNLLNLMAIEDWSLRSAAYPVYAVLVSGLMNVLLFPRLAKRSGHSADLVPSSFLRYQREAARSLRMTILELLETETEHFEVLDLSRPASRPKGRTQRPVPVHSAL
jgi:hypothetical protein